MEPYLAGKVVAVTGAGRGIGRAVALCCAAEGAAVVVNDYGVSVDGRAPTSTVARAVAEEIRDGGGRAAANADSVTTMEGGAGVVDTALAEFGRIDGVVCVAGILRERMLFNMAEDEWDPVIETHLKGTFTVFRAASAVMRGHGGGALVGFTSGNHAGSVSQANYSAAKGGIVSLVRSAALGLGRYGITANAVAPVARTRMSANVPFEMAEMGEPEDVAPLVAYLLGEAARDITGQIYTVAGRRIAVWNQPREIRSMYAEEPWTAASIARRLPETIGAETMPMIAKLAAYARATGSGQAARSTESATTAQPAPAAGANGSAGSAGPGESAGSAGPASPEGPDSAGKS